jgi:hypothetical protein
MDYILGTEDGGRGFAKFVDETGVHASLNTPTLSNCPSTLRISNTVPRMYLRSQL